MQKLSIGISPCPNDTFIFHGLIKGLVPSPAPLEWVLDDVESLNLRLRNSSNNSHNNSPDNSTGQLDVCKVSMGALSSILDDYVVLRSGGAIGLSCGPVLVASQGTKLSALQHAQLAVPGLHTTANNLLSMYGRLNDNFQGQRTALRFDKIMPAVSTKEFAAGLLIHEGRFTFAEHGLECLLDLGQWWESYFKLPLALGVIVAKRSLGRQMHLALEQSFKASLTLAQNNEAEFGAKGSFNETWAYIKEQAQELDDAVIKAHIKTFVTKWSMEYGESGEAAILAFLTQQNKILGAAKQDFSSQMVFVN